MEPQHLAIKLVECPRDAMQGLATLVSTENKIKYLNLLLQVGFDILDFGSFVSPKLVPQMADTAAVLGGLDLSLSNTKLLAIVANLQGAENALKYPEITYLGFPFSISETFQKRNTNSSISESLVVVEQLVDKCSTHQKNAVIYLSMAFGNPYGDSWNEDTVENYCAELVKRGVTILSLADTTGVATPASIKSIFKNVSKSFPQLELGVHLHSTPQTWQQKIEAAYISGCRHFDSALKGFGGCPMASDNLTGNIATENLLRSLYSKNEDLNIKEDKLREAMNVADTIFI